MAGSIAAGGASDELAFTFHGFKLVRLYKVLRLLGRADTLAKWALFKPAIITIIKLMVIFLWIFHIVTCAFWRVIITFPVPDGWERDTTWYVLPEVRDADTVWPQYLVSLHWALSTLTGNETGPTNVQ